MNYLMAVDYWFADAPGGAARVAYDMAALIRERGHHVAALTFMPRGRELPEVSVEHGMTIVRARRPEVPGWRPDAARRSIAAAAAAARRHLDDRRWDVVHTHTIYPGNAALETFGPRPRYVATIHSPVGMELAINWAGGGVVGWLKRRWGLPLMSRLEGRLVRQAACVHALSEYTKRQMQRIHGVGERTVVIPYWRREDLRRSLSKQEARARLGWPAAGPIAFTVRALIERNGLDVAIEALAPAVREGRCRLYVGGSGALRPRLEGLAAERGMSGGTTFMGRISDEELALAYQAADLFLLPTRALECFGLIIIEALSYGCPVIGTDAGAIPEALTPLGPQFVVPAGDAGALRESVEAFLSGRLAAPPAEALVSYVAQRYDRDVVAPRIVELLEGGSSGGGGARARSEAKGSVGSAAVRG